MYDPISQSFKVKPLQDSTRKSPTDSTHQDSRERMIIETASTLTPWSQDQDSALLLRQNIDVASPEGSPYSVPRGLRPVAPPVPAVCSKTAHTPPEPQPSGSLATEQQDPCERRATPAVGAQVSLYPKDDVPPVFWEIGILHGYRKPGSSATECMISALVLTNETLNFWTHFISAWYFVFQFNQFFESDLPGGHTRHDQMTWPFFAYLATICVWPLASAAAHLFNVISIEARHICFFVDYVFLAIYCFGSALAYQAYCTNVHWWYIPVALVASYLCTGVACASRFVQRPSSRKVMRVLAFMVPYIIVGCPLFRRILTDYGGEGGPLGQLAVKRHLGHISLAVVMGAVYSAHLPERWAPGKFDLVGHSHQIMHIIAIGVTYVQMWAVFSDMEHSFERGRSWADGSYGFQVIAWFLLSVAGNLAIFAYYIGRLRKILKAQEHARARDGSRSESFGSPLGSPCGSPTQTGLTSIPCSMVQLDAVVNAAMESGSVVRRNNTTEHSLMGSCFDLSQIGDEAEIEEVGNGRVKFE